MSGATITVYAKHTTKHPKLGKLVYGEPKQIPEEKFSDVLFSKTPLNEVKKVKKIKKKAKKRGDLR
jgi:hypothetical protein